MHNSRKARISQEKLLRWER